MQIIDGLKYTKSHEWVKVEGDQAWVGVTDFAQSHLGEIVFVELPEAGDELTTGNPLGVVESVKAASDVYSPVSGTVEDVNEELLDSPGKINEDAYESWFIRLKLSDPSELEGLLDASDYEKLCQEEED